MERGPSRARIGRLPDATGYDGSAFGTATGDSASVDSRGGGPASEPSMHDGPLDALLAETPEITALGRRTALGVMLFLDQAPTMAVAVLDVIDAGRHTDALPAVRGLRRVAEELGLLRLAGVCMGLEAALHRGDATGACRWAARLHDSVARARRLLRDFGAPED